MKKIFSFMIMTLLIITGAILHTNMETSYAEEEMVPSYAKWGRLAMKETMEKYPQAEIVDYSHLGEKSKGENTVEQFKLWLKEDGKEFGVFIDIEFHPETEEIVSVTFRESET